MAKDGDGDCAKTTKNPNPRGSESSWKLRYPELVPHLSHLIIAIDADSLGHAAKLGGALAQAGFDGTVKLGPDLMHLGGRAFIDELNRVGFKVFADLKLHDIPTTVSRTVKVLNDQKIYMITLHIRGGPRMMAEAVKAANSSTFKSLLLGVTGLTSVREPLESILNLAGRAEGAGFDGVICPPNAVAAVRSVCSKEFLIVTPGIRFEGGSIDDHYSIGTPEYVMRSGADKIVVGRPIRGAQNIELSMISVLGEVKKGLDSLKTN